MSKTNNAVLVKSGRIQIVEPQIPVQFTFLMILFISGFQGFFSLLKYLENGETGHLFITSFMLSLFVLAVIKEMFFVSYKKEIDIKEVSAIKIQPILFGKGTVFLEFKIKKKTRQVLLAKEYAQKISAELRPHISNKKEMAKNNP